MPQQASLVKDMLEIMEASRAGFGQERVFRRAVMLALAEILTFGQHHITDLLRSVGLTEEDWSAWYRLLQQPQRFDEAALGKVLVEQTAQQVGPNEPYVVGIDTTSVPRTSARLEGSGWHKCPRNPPWRVGIHRAQRFLNISWLGPLQKGYSRAIPLRFMPCFTEKATRRAYPAVLEQQAGVEALQWVHQQLQAHGSHPAGLLALADGSYDKPDFWTQLPPATVARTAKNRVLKYLPPPYGGRGRRRKYGERAPAPQAYLSQRAGWQTLSVPVRGKTRRMVACVAGPFLREKMPDLPLMLIAVRGQQWAKAGRQRRREPVFYLVNAAYRDGQWQLPLPLETLLAWAWQRWELEVVHREVKSIFGLGDKQCFHPRAAVTSVQWSAWVYSLLILTTYRRLGPAAHPKRPAAWQRHARRWTLQTVLDAFRLELMTFADFSWLCSRSAPTWQKFESHLLALTLPPLREALF